MAMDDASIPRPDLASWMHARIPVPAEPLERRRERHEMERRRFGTFVSFVSRLARRFHVVRYRWFWYRIFTGFGHAYMRLVHRLEVRGRELVPRGGCIMYLLHNGDSDVVNFLLAFKDPAGVFTDVGNGFFADFLENVYGFVPRRGARDVMVEKMVRAILLRNRYFVMWPEGSPSRDGRPMEAFSGVVRVYATVNARKDVIPFQPVLMRGAEIFQHKGSRRPRKVLVEFLKPVFLPRLWLAEPAAGGKSPREIINILMLHLARKAGFSSLKKNWALERRRGAAGRPWH